MTASQSKPTITTGSKAKPEAGASSDETHSPLVEVIDLEDAKAVESYWEQKPPESAGGPKSLLSEILKGVMEGRPKKASWTPLRLELGLRNSDRRDSLQVKTVLVRKSLYLRRPVIAFERIRLEECMTRLATKAGLRHAQRRAHNPVISWKRENVTVVEAITSILKEHGFKHRLSGCFATIRSKLKDQKLRREFIETTVKKILDGGRALERDVPTLVVYPLQKSGPKKGEESVEKKEQDEESAQPE